MAFEKGHIKLGGRQKGSSNKKTIMKAEEILAQSGINPIQKLLEIAESEETTTDQRINCYKEIAKYTYPRLKLQDVRVGHYDLPQSVEITIVSPEGPKKTLEK